VVGVVGVVEVVWMVKMVGCGEMFYDGWPSAELWDDR
jgi:hypothetical protein